MDDNKKSFELKTNADIEKSLANFDVKKATEKIAKTGSKGSHLYNAIKCINDYMSKADADKSKTDAEYLKKCMRVLRNKRSKGLRTDQLKLATNFLVAKVTRAENLESSFNAFKKWSETYLINYKDMYTNRSEDNEDYKTLKKAYDILIANS